MKEAGITANDVDHVNAEAGGWPELDAWEARAIAEVFGKTVPVFAAKGHLGNSGAASGPVELSASLLGPPSRHVCPARSTTARRPELPRHRAYR